MVDQGQDVVKDMIRALQLHPRRGLNRRPLLLAFSSYRTGLDFDFRRRLCRQDEIVLDLRQSGSRS